MMKRYRQFALAVTLMGSLAACGGSDTPAPGNGTTAAPGKAEVVFFMNARLIPGDGSAPIEEATMIVENGKIKQIGQKGELKAPKGSARFELEVGQTIMPMMESVHVHPGLVNGATFGPSNYNRQSVLNDLNRYEYYGINAVLSAGTDAGDTAFKIRDEQRAGTLGGALLYTAGQGITAKGGWPSPILGDIPIQVSTEAEARKAVDDDADKKVDFIKIWVDDIGGTVPKLKPELYKAVIDEAHKRNLHVVAHVFYLADAKELVAAGIDGLMHSIRDREVDDDLINAMKAKNVFLTPTLTAAESKFIYADKPDWLGEQSMKEVYPASLSAYLADEVTVNKFKRDPNLAEYRKYFETAKKNLKKMADAGVTIAMGTDSGTKDTFPGYFEHRELELMVAAGMSPTDVIKAATVTGAAVLGMKDNGALAVGKYADFIVLGTNPLEKITNSKDIATIYRHGAQVERLPLIPGDIEVTGAKITSQDRKADAEAQHDAAVKESGRCATPLWEVRTGAQQPIHQGYGNPAPEGFDHQRQQWTVTEQIHRFDEGIGRRTARLLRRGPAEIQVDCGGKLLGTTKPRYKQNEYGLRRDVAESGDPDRH